MQITMGLPEPREFLSRDKCAVKQHSSDSETGNSVNTLYNVQKFQDKTGAPSPRPSTRQLRWTQLPDWSRNFSSPGRHQRFNDQENGKVE